MDNSFPQYMLLAPPISSVSFLKQYLITNRDFKPPHNIIFFIPVLPFILESDIILSTPISKNLSLCSSFLVRDQVSHPYKTTCKVMVLCILIIIFFSRKLDGR